MLLECLCDGGFSGVERGVESKRYEYSREYSCKVEMWALCFINPNKAVNG